jgi:predicted O-methyltransferase YrrM
VTLLVAGLAVLLLIGLGAAGARHLRHLTAQLRKIDSTIAATTKDHAAGLRTLRRQVDHDAINRQRAQMRELEALQQLYADFRPRAPMPSTGQWALNPTDLLALLDLVERRRPPVIVELGSGTSTVWLAYAVQRYGGRVVSLDHEIRYADRTRLQLHAHGLDAVAEVRDAPLNQIEVQGTEYDWYDPDALEDIERIDLLVVDGPPGSLGPFARYPALTALKPKLAGDATIVLDDVSRDDEQETVRRWLYDDAALTVEPALLGQHAVLSYGRPPAAAGT